MTGEVNASVDLDFLRGHGFEEVADELEKLRDLNNKAVTALVKCEKACWQEEQDYSGLSRDVRRITSDFYRESEKMGFVIISK